jgi:hypothetical protein
VAERERRKVLGWLARGVLEGPDGTPAPVADPEVWLADAERAALAMVAERGEVTAAELTAADPKLATQLVLAWGQANEGRQSMASRVLFLLAAQGRVIRGRPRGSWTSHQYRWAALGPWCPGGLDGWGTPEAEVELARRWLAAYGPATADDLRWWAGWTQAQVRRALTALTPVEVDLDGTPGVMLPGDDEPPPAAGPWAALLPALDCTPMGWQQRDWFLGEHGPALFDRNGNIGPSLWWDGRIVGGWAQDAGGRVVCRFLEDAGSDAVTAAQQAADRLEKLLDGVRLTARTRGPTWLERELTG